jgi:hypothetical protein
MDVTDDTSYVVANNKRMVPDGRRAALANIARRRFA